MPSFCLKCFLGTVDEIDACRRDGEAMTHFWPPDENGFNRGVPARWSQRLQPVSADEMVTLAS